ncbi:hypothetical protein Pstr01_07090 [Pseudomonas straminea]|nr:hypothetical protein Pstr01_07090 [Pseudomonas straminea]
MAREQIAQQAPDGPAGLMFEAIDQRIDRKSITPGRFDTAEWRRAFQATAACQAIDRQRQSADLAMGAEPRQLSVTLGAER